MAVVKLDRLTKIYDRSHEPAAKDVSLEIGDGEFMVLLGPSGCGKTTTLRMIAGLESISSGTLTIDDEVVNRAAAKDRDIAMVFQSYALYPHMTVKNNLAFGLRRRSIDRAEIERRVQDVAGILGLSDLLGRKPTRCPAGSASELLLAAPSLEIRRSFFLTNLSQISMQHCGCQPAVRLPVSIAASAQQ